MGHGPVASCPLSGFFVFTGPESLFTGIKGMEGIDQTEGLEI
jgi:hypothetical protein